MSGGTIVAAGAALGGLAVALGAFAAHGLRARVTPEMLAVFETGVRYHFYHAVALVVLGVFSLAASEGGKTTVPGTSAVAWCFMIGIVVFSGSLYAMTFSGVRWLGAITPIGGGSFLVGWALFTRAALRL